MVSKLPLPRLPRLRKVRTSRVYLAQFPPTTGEVDDDLVGYLADEGASEELITAAKELAARSHDPAPDAPDGE